MAQNVQDLLNRFDAIHARYQGVRGALLGKVRVALAGAATPKDLMARFDAVAAKYQGVRGALLKKVREQLTGGGLTAAPDATARAVMLAPAPAVQAPQPQASVESIRQLRRSTPEQKAAVANMLPSCRVCGRGMKPAGSGTLVCEKGHVRNLAS